MLRMERVFRGWAAMLVVGAACAGATTPRPALAGAEAADATMTTTTEIEKMVANLPLTDAQRRAMEPLLRTYRDKERAARAELLAKLKTTIPADQYARFANATNGPATRPAKEIAAGVTQLPVTFEGGYDTDPVDRGRPVVLVASALGVPSDVFRKAFSGVTPAGPGQQPQDAQVRKNKQALMSVLSPYGVTNDRLDEVSNYYRYNRGRGETWRHTPASATAQVRDGVVIGFTLTDAGAGYSSPPTVGVAGMPGVKVVVKLAFGTDFDKNGSVESIELAGPSSAGAK